MTVYATFFLDNGTRAYTPTDQDVFWLAKALYMESKTEPGRIAAAWTMMQRFLRWPGGQWSLWTDMMRAFSQPINPIWADPESAKCKNNPSACTPEMIARRKKIQGWTWEQIPWVPRKIAQAFARGEYDNPVPWAVDFAASWLVERQGKTGQTIGGNTFVDADQDGMRWKNSYVSVDPVYDVPGGGVDPDVDFDFEPQEDVETELIERPFFRGAVALGVLGAAGLLGYNFLRGK